MKENDNKFSHLNVTEPKPRSLPICEWPRNDRQAWEEACRPGIRLKRGGRASYLAPISRADFANRYGAFLGFLQRAGRLDRGAVAASQVTPQHVAAYSAELKKRVRSVTVWNCIYKLRRAAELLDPRVDFGWLAEIEGDLALVMVPKSKFDRVVLSERLVEAGLTLVAEAEGSPMSAFERAKGIRNGLMIALLALRPMRVKNFASLEIGHNFKQVRDSWWISLPARSTKTGASEEGRVPNFMNHAVELYLEQARPILIGAKPATNSLWISSRTGRQITTKNLGTLISKITFRTVGVDVSPHLFRKAAATTAALYGGDTPHLASAVLGHTDPRVTYEHYNQAKSVNAAQVYAALVGQYRTTEGTNARADDHK